MSHLSQQQRTERPRKAKIGTEVAHVTRDSDTTFKVKGQLAVAWEHCGGLAYIVNIYKLVNIHGAHNYWKQGALGAAGVRDGLQLGRSVQATVTGIQRAGAYCVTTCTACWS